MARRSRSTPLDPSIGNWSFPCQSHYWIRNDRVKWAPKWSREQIERRRRYDHHAKESYFEIATSETAPGTTADAPEAAASKRGLWSAVKSWFAKST